MSPTAPRSPAPGAAPWRRALGLAAALLSSAGAEPLAAPLAEPLLAQAPQTLPRPASVPGPRVTPGARRANATSAEGPGAPMTSARFDTTAFAALRWREVGPARGGRSVAVAGSEQRPLEYWMGTTGGGVFKTTDGGMNWSPASDRYFGGTIGAITVDPTNPDVVYVGGGETDIRGNTAHGDGLWKTTDAGRTWSMLGFKSEHISAIRIHPSAPQTVWLGVFGLPFKASADRGVYKSTDGGRTFAKVLFVNDSTGAIDLSQDPSNPDVMYAAMWQAYRTPWSLSSGGPHSAIYKTTDGGRTWTNLMQTARGLPTGVLGKIGIAVSPAKPSRVWALIEHDSGGVYRSDDAGATWQYLNQERKLRQRAWYYSHIYADPKDTNVVYALNTGFYKSRDGGRTFPTSFRVPHGDNHDLWIAPNDPARMVNGNDGGANVSVNAGQTWTDQEYATAQFYHVSTTNEFPYNICGAQQDNSTLCGPSRKPGGITMNDWYDAGGCESGYVSAHPTKPHITFAGCYGGNLDRRDRRYGFTRDVTVYPINPMGQSSEDIKVRFQWTFPIVFSRHDPNTLYAAGSQLFRSTDEGQSWTAVSPELARRDPKTMGPSGGPITKDQTGVETYGVVFAFDESPLQKGLLWAGTDDGLVHVSRNGGQSWTNVTPRDIGDFTRISIIEPSSFEACRAYVAANRYQLEDKRPILYRTTDCGASWTRIDAGIAADEFTRVVREDPVRRGLLYAGTERGVWVSFDDGGSWQKLQRNLPPVPVHDLVVKEGDLVVATHGRSFWVMDDLSALRQLTPEVAAKDAHLFRPRDTYRIDWGGSGFAALFGGGGNNPPSGAVVYYHLKQPNQTVELDFLDAQGKVIRTFTSAQDSATAADSTRLAERRGQRVDSLVAAGMARDSAQRVVRAEASAAPGGGGIDFEAMMRTGPRPPRVPNRAGLNQFAWNLRYPDAVRFENMILWAGTTTGPMAPPGTYAVRMRVGGQPVATESFAVRIDPRKAEEGVTVAHLKEQFDFLMRIRDRTSDANNAVRTVRNVRAQVEDRTPQMAGKPQEGEFRTTSSQLLDELAEPEQEIYQVKNQSSQDPLNYPIKLNNKIAALAGVVSSGDYRPTKQSYAAFTTLSEALDVELRKVRRALDETLPKVNAALRGAGVKEIVPSAEELRANERVRKTISMDDAEALEAAAQQEAQARERAGRRRW